MAKSFDTKYLNTDWQAEINAAVNRGDYVAAANAERIRNRKIDHLDSTGTNAYGATKTNNYSSHLGTQTPSSFSFDVAAPEWRDAYKNAFNAALDAVTGYKDFSYSPETDPLYGAYSKAYAREGQRSIADTLGQVSAQTGGLPSSYATTAAAQAGNHYAAQMADKIPQLQQQAYDQYLNDFAIRQAQLTAADTARSGDYMRYLDEWTQYNTDRNFAYGQHLDQIDYNTQKRNESLDLAAQLYGATGDASAYAALGFTPENIEALNAAGAANQQALATDRAYNKALLDQLMQQISRAETENAQADELHRAQMAQTSRDNALSDAELLYSTTGDASGYAALGFTPEQIAAMGNRWATDNDYYNRTMQAELDNITRSGADWKAGYGDYSGLNALGVDTSQLMAERQYNNALMMAELDRMINPQKYATGIGGSGTAVYGSGPASGLGVIDTMLSLGNDGYALEYLIGQGYTQAQTQQMYDLYLKQKATAAKQAFAPTSTPFSGGYDDDTVQIDGLGAVTWEQAEQLMANGQVVEEVDAYGNPKLVKTNNSRYLHARQ